jgi:aldehyde dehydrogenase (NAD+)
MDQKETNPLTAENTPLLEAKAAVIEDPVIAAAKKRALEPPLSPADSLEHLKTHFQTLNLMQLNFRKSQLAAIKRILQKYQEEFCLSQWGENNTPRHVAYLQCMLVYDTCDYLIENLNDWAADQGVMSILAYFPAKNYVKPQGKGVCCVFGGAKFSLSSVLVPMLYAVASGNCVLIKGCHENTETVKFLKKLSFEAFDPRFYRLIEGDYTVDAALFGMQFDGFYYSGNPIAGRDLLNKAGKNLVPCTVDMETKCPTVIDASADLEHAARVIASHAFMNGGMIPYNTD